MPHTQSPHPPPLSALSTPAPLALSLSHPALWTNSATSPVTCFPPYSPLPPRAGRSSHLHTSSSAADGVPGAVCAACGARRGAEHAQRAHALGPAPRGARCRLAVLGKSNASAQEGWACNREEEIELEQGTRGRSEGGGGGRPAGSGASKGDEKAGTGSGEREGSKDEGGGGNGGGRGSEGGGSEG